MRDGSIGERRTWGCKMFNLTWFDAILWWIAIFFGGLVVFAVFTRHRARWTLVWLYLIIIVLIALIAAIGADLGLV